LTAFLANLLITLGHLCWAAAAANSNLLALNEANSAELTYAYDFVRIRPRPQGQ
jgi:hypothetical protein